MSATFTAWSTGMLNKSLWNAYTNILHIHLTEYLAYASLHSQMLQRGSCFCKTKQKHKNIKTEHKRSGKLHFKKKKTWNFSSLNPLYIIILYTVNYHKLQNCRSFWQNTRDQSSSFISPCIFLLSWTFTESDSVKLGQIFYRVLITKSSLLSIKWANVLYQRFPKQFSYSVLLTTYVSKCN